MALALLIGSLDDVDEQYRDLYSPNEAGDGFVLDVEDKDYKKKLDEFRTNNRAKFREIEELKKKVARYDGVDLDEYERAKEALAKLEDDDERKLIKDGKFDDVVERRVGNMKKDFDAQRKALEKARDEAATETAALRGELGVLKIDDAITAALAKLKVKVRPGAADDVKARTRAVWKINSKAEMVPGEGSAIVYGKDGEPITMDEYAAQLFEKAPFLFEGSAGGDASGGTRKAAGGGKVKEIVSGDPINFGKHLEDIASGKVKVKHS